MKRERAKEKKNSVLVHLRPKADVFFSLLYDKSDDEDDSSRHKRRAAEKAIEGTEDMEMLESIEKLEDTKGHSIKEWLSLLGPRTEIINRFKHFLRTYVDEKGQHVYRDRIHRMCEKNKSSFVVVFSELAHNQHVLAYFLPEAPLQMLEIFDKVAKEMVLSIFPSYERVTTNCIWVSSQPPRAFCRNSRSSSTIA